MSSARVCRVGREHTAAAVEGLEGGEKVLPGCEPAVDCNEHAAWQAAALRKRPQVRQQLCTPLLGHILNHKRTSDCMSTALHATAGH